MKNIINAKTLKDLLWDDKEIALIDIREVGQHANGHPFFSVSIPYKLLMQI